MYLSVDLSVMQSLKTTFCKRCLVLTRIEALKLFHLQVLHADNSFLFFNTGKWKIGSGKQIVRLPCPKGKLEFRFLSSTDQFFDIWLLYNCMGSQGG